ncbi:Thioesterase/thiol ester dehydrase-isomerase [Pisolithus marmoratus]|nr:Thioesterase/thiol ester dehydrase-isomerase [Pisolithus marmoratus]
MLRSGCARPRLLRARLRSDRVFLSGSSIESLQAAFRDPPSPFHIPPGETGPASPDDPQEPCGNGGFNLEQGCVPHDASPEERARKAREVLVSMGYDTDSLWEQSIAWGHHDAFRHVNNAHYLRFIESGRIQWMSKLGNALGGKERVDAMLAGEGVSVILKSININFRRPVTFPDTLLVGHKAIVSSSRTQFLLDSVLYSYAQQRVVADAESVIVWYDYDRLKKCDPGDVAWRVLRDSMGAGYRESIGPRYPTC